MIENQVNLNLKPLKELCAKGEFFHENNYMGFGGKRVIRVFNKRRTHTIDLQGDQIVVESDTTSKERVYQLSSAKEAAEFWAKQGWNKVPEYDARALARQGKLTRY